MREKQIKDPGLTSKRRSLPEPLAELDERSHWRLPRLERTDWFTTAAPRRRLSLWSKVSVPTEAEPMP